MSGISGFDIHKMSDIIDEIQIHPTSIPDHSLLTCELLTPSMERSDNASASDVRSPPSKTYNTRAIPPDFMLDDDARAQVQQTLQRIEHAINLNTDIQCAYDEFLTVIRSEMEKRLPAKRYHDRNKTYSKYKPYWNDLLTEQWNITRESERRWLRCTGSGQEKRKLREKFCGERKVFDKLNRKFKRQYQKQERLRIHDQLCNSNQNEFWRSIGKVGLANDRQKRIPWAVVDNEGQIHTDRVTVLEKWKSDFQELYNADNVGHIPDALGYLPQTPDCSVLNEPISRFEICKAVDAAKLGKAAGVDEIPAEVLKNDSVVDMLLKFCNGCFDLGRVPTEWTRGIINPIYKPGSDDDRDPLNYRGITLISVPCKIYCSVLNARLTSWLEANDQLCDEQNGFRRGRSCEDHIYTLHTVVNDRKISRQSTYVSFIDLRKAFDTVDRTMLWFKLHRTGVRGKFYTALQSLYQDTKCTVKVNGERTPWFRVPSGVKQGCVLSPTMFSVYINDLAVRINDARLGVSVGDAILSILLYADDIALIAPDASSLQSMLDIVAEWSNTWGLSINPRKTKVVHFRNPSVPETITNFRCGEFDIEKADSYKYLGIWFDQHLRMDKAVKELAKSASRALGALFGKFIDAGGMTFDVYSKLYTTIVEPILFYASGIWGTKQHAVINAVQNKAQRFLLAVGRNTSNAAVRGDIGWSSCKIKQDIACVRLMCKIVRSDDNRILRKTMEWSSRRRKGWVASTNRIIAEIDTDNLVHNRNITTKTVVKRLSEKLYDIDKRNWREELFNDRNLPNGNKLRTYRMYKQELCTEAYVNVDIPRKHRRALA